MTRPVLLAGALLVVAAAACRPTSPSARHFVLVTLDTVRADRLGSYGRADAGTLWLDGMAARGTRFHEAYTPVPLTLPAHVSLFAGRYPSHTGIHLNGVVAASRVPLAAEILAKQGFFTAAAVGGFPLTGGFATRRGFESYDDRLRVGAGGEALERPAIEVVQAGLAALEDRRDRRVFLWIHLYDPHDPYEPPWPFKERFARDPYQGEIAALDPALSMLEEGITQSLGEDVLFAIVADHGEGLGEHGEDTHGYFLYGSTVRVPFILAGPRVPAGQVERGPVSLVDLLPTVLSLLGVTDAGPFDGRVLSLDEDTSAGSTLFFETLLPQSSYGFAPLRAALHSGLKYISAPRPELYELRSDPGELRNALADHPEAAADLARALASQASEVTAPAVSLDPRFSSLGYLGTGASTGGQTDPKDGLPVYRDFQAASRALEAGHPEDAMPALDRLLAREDNAGIRLKRAQALRMLARFDDAESELARAKALGGSLPPGWHLEKARVAVAGQDWASAREQAAAHLREAPGSPVGLLLHGAAEEYLGDVQAAERNYREALATDATYRDASLRLAALLVRSGRIPEARVVLETHLRWHSDDALARGLLGSL